MGRCDTGRELVDGVTPQGIWQWSHEIIYEWPALMKALVLRPDC